MKVISIGTQKTWSAEVCCGMCKSSLLVELADVYVRTARDARGEETGMWCALCPVCGSELYVAMTAPSAAQFPAKDAWVSREFVNLHKRIAELTPRPGGSFDR